MAASFRCDFPLRSKLAEVARGEGPPARVDVGQMPKEVRAIGPVQLAVLLALAAVRGQAVDELAERDRLMLVEELGVVDADPGDPVAELGDPQPPVGLEHK